MRTVVSSVAALIGLLVPLAAAGTIYVDNDASPGGNGAGWVSAFKYLQDALAVAAAGDQIFVAQGTYKPDQDEAGNATPGDRQATFQLRSGVGLYGGYRGCPGGDCAGGDPDARDIALYVTILSGDLLGDDGPDFANNGENSYRVVSANGTEITTRFDGFTVTAGNADGDGAERSGSGLYISQGALAVTNCTFSRNATLSEGAAVHAAGGNGPVLTGCTVSANRAAGFACEQGAAPCLTGCSITANTRLGVTLRGNAAARVADCTIARNAGAGLDCSGDVTVTGCIISGNGTSPNIIDQLAGGVSCAIGARVTIVDCVITGNQQPTWGIWAWGGGVHCECGAVLTMANCTIWWNESPAGGGGLGCDGCIATLTGCSINGNWGFANPDYYGNTWNVDGGGVWAADGASLTLNACTLAGNYASGYGGAVHALDGCSLTITGTTFGGNLSGVDGGAIEAVYASLALAGCTFTGNRAYESGGAVHAEGPLTAQDCTFVGNTSSQNGGALHTSSSGDATTLTNCLFAGNVAVQYGGALIGEFMGASTLTSCTFVENNGRYDAVHGVGDPLTIVNSILWHDGPVEVNPGCVVEFSDVTGGWPGSGNIGSDPHFVAGPSGTWTAPGVFNWRTYQVTFTDANAAWADNELVGKLIKPNAYMTYQFSIIANTATTITIWADALAVLIEGSWPWVSAGTAYRVCDYRLAADSPCINAGSNYAPALPAADLGGAPRIQRCRADMGAYESPFAPATFLDCNHNGVNDDCDVLDGTSLDANQNGIPDECERCAGDLNCDGRIDFADINAFVAYLSDFGQWRASYRGCGADNGDLNCDGTFGPGSFGDIDPFVSLLSSAPLPIACPGPVKCR